MMRLFLFNCALLFINVCFSWDLPDSQPLPAPSQPLLILPSPATEIEIAQQNEEEVQRVNAILNQARVAEEWNDYVSEGVHTPP